MYWNEIYINENIMWMRKYFEKYMQDNGYEVDTYQCDKLIEICYKEVTNNENVIFDDDYDMFYNFMVDNIV